MSRRKQVRIAANLDRTRRALVQQTAVMLVGVGSIAIVAALRLTNLPLPTTITCILGLTACGFSIVLARSHLPVAVGGVFLIGSWLAALFIVAYMRGGLGAPLLIAVPIIPVIAATVLSPTSAWVVFASILTALGVLAGLELGDHQFPQSTSENTQYNMMRAAWIALASLVAAKLATYNTQRNEELTRSLHELASTDALTGVPNRRAITEQLDLEVARAVRNNAWLAILMLDIDHFKRLNDNRGHQAGDEALARIAQSIADGLRAGGDEIGRWGGEEFIVLLPHATVQKAMTAARRIQRQVEQCDIHYQVGSRDTVTLTIGVVARCGEQLVDASDLVNLADQALYRGKRDGRNQINVAPAALQPAAPR